MKCEVMINIGGETFKIATNIEERVANNIGLELLDNFLTQLSDEDLSKIVDKIKESLIESKGELEINLKKLTESISAHNITVKQLASLFNSRLIDIPTDDSFKNTKVFFVDEYTGLNELGFGRSLNGIWIVDRKNLGKFANYLQVVLSLKNKADELLSDYEKNVLKKLAELIKKDDDIDPEFKSLAGVISYFLINKNYFTRKTIKYDDLEINAREFLDDIALKILKIKHRKHFKYSGVTIVNNGLNFEYTKDKNGHEILDTNNANIDVNELYSALQTGLFPLEISFEKILNFIDSKGGKNNNVINGFKQVLDKLLFNDLFLDIINKINQSPDIFPIHFKEGNTLADYVILILSNLDESWNFKVKQIGTRLIHLTRKGRTLSEDHDIGFDTLANKGTITPYNGYYIYTSNTRPGNSYVFKHYPLANYVGIRALFKGLGSKQAAREWIDEINLGREIYSNSYADFNLRKNKYDVLTILGKKSDSYGRVLIMYKYSGNYSLDEPVTMPNFTLSGKEQLFRSYNALLSAFDPEYSGRRITLKEFLNLAFIPEFTKANYPSDVKALQKKLLKVVKTPQLAAVVAKLFLLHVFSKIQHNTLNGNNPGIDNHIGMMLRILDDFEKNNKPVEYFIQRKSDKDFITIYPVDDLSIYRKSETTEDFKRENKRLLKILSDSVDKKTGLEGMVDGMRNRFGVKVELIYGNEILGKTHKRGSREERLLQILTLHKGAKAFFFEDTIYLDYSKANMDDLFHEYVHLALGILKAKNPNLYYTLVNRFWETSDSSMKNYIQETYSEYTYTQQQEEFFALKMGLYLEGIDFNNEEIINAKNLIEQEVEDLDKITTLRDFQQIFAKFMMKSDFFKKNNKTYKSHLAFNNWIKDNLVKSRKDLKEGKILEECS